MNQIKRNQITLVVIMITFFITILSINSSRAATDIELLTKAIKHKLEVRKKGVGVAAVVIDGDRTELLTFGVSNKLKGTLVNDNSLFEIGSVTKTFTTLALASMVEEGKVKLTDPVQAYLPAKLRLPTKNGKAITFLSLANHSSGLPRLPANMPFGDPLDPYADYTVDMMYDFLNDYELPREVGEKTEYSNLGMGLLGHVLSLIDNKSFEQMIRDRVLEPLAMNATYANVPQSVMANLSQGYDEQLKPTKHWQLPTMAGAGVLKSNAEDMAMFLKAQMHKRPLERAISMTQTVTADFDGPNAKIGLGWLRLSRGQNEFYMHNGITGAFRTFVGFNPKENKGIVLMVNSVFDLDQLGVAYLTNTLQDIELKAPFKATEAELVNVNGKYELVPGFVLSITNENDRLFVQATGQPRLPLEALSASEFINETVKARLIFSLDDAGLATSLTFHQAGQVLPGKKL